MERQFTLEQTVDLLLSCSLNSLAITCDKMEAKFHLKQNWPEDFIFDNEAILNAARILIKEELN